jgi:hypothetical protein
MTSRGVLRGAWFSIEMGEQLMPDRFVDIFQGTVKGVERLKAIYDKANLNIIS